jgi:ABC-type Fe3+-hydroxamate transport system substrate-binding protein
MTDALPPGIFSNWELLGFPHPPQRVVSLVPSVTESLIGLGVAAALVGVTDYCVRPAAQTAELPKVGGTKNPDLARVKAALPDLIIANREENRSEDLEALAAAGFKIWLTFPCTVREAIDVLWDMTKLFHLPHMGQGLSVLETGYEWASLAAPNSPTVKVFCPIWREPAAADGLPRWWMTANRHTYLHDLLALCGGENVFAGRERRYPLAADLGEAAAEATDPERDTRYPRVSPAEVAAAAPEVILLPSEPYPFGEADLAALDAWPDIPAVKSARVHFVDGSLLTWPGIRLTKALSELPVLLGAPETFPDDLVG